MMKIVFNKTKLAVHILLFVLISQNCIGQETNTSAAVSTNNLSDDPIYSFSNLLWIGAHPDDEIPSSAFLKDFCNRKGKKCTLMILTRGGTGACKLSSGCMPDLVTVRANELRESGAYLNMDIRQFYLSDSAAGSKNGVFAAWGGLVGGNDALVSLMQYHINNIRPDLIVTFDPRHGTTCHPDHQAAGMLAILGAQRAGIPSTSIYMIESLINGVGFQAAVATDKNVETYSIENNWSTLIDLMGLVYKSQYYSSEVATLEGIPSTGRTFSFMKFSEAVKNDPKYSSLCN